MDSLPDRIRRAFFGDDRDICRTSTHDNARLVIWQELAERTDEISAAEERLVELLSQHDELTLDLEHEIETTLYDIRDGWREVERRADAGVEHDSDLERIRRQAAERAALYQDHFEAFRDDPERFVSERGRSAVEMSPDVDASLESSQSPADAVDQWPTDPDRLADADSIDPMPNSSGRGLARMLVDTLCGFVLWIGYWILLFVLALFAKLVPFLVAVAALAVFFIGILLLDPVLSLFGLSEQAIAAVVGVGVIVGLWVVAIAAYLWLARSNGDE